tara:strand:- start:280 stop:750 length:471 start_codon:yes stop_codon:yes gene_type:complete
MKRTSLVILSLLLFAGCSGENSKEPKIINLECEVREKYQQLDGLFNENESFILAWSKVSDGPDVLYYSNDGWARPYFGEKKPGHDDMHYRFYDMFMWSESFSDGKKDDYISWLVFTLNRITQQMTIKQTEVVKNERASDEYNGLWYKYDCSEVEKI